MYGKIIHIQNSYTITSIKYTLSRFTHKTKAAHKNLVLSFLKT